jgi:hypothetical protein
VSRRCARLLGAALGPALLVALALVFPGAAAAATWCGSTSSADRTPQAAAGYSVHLVYAVPSDGADGIATWGSAMQTDAETIDAWWRREDPARTVRFDTFSFACGTQLDISFLRLQQTGAQLDPIDRRADRVYDGLRAAGLLSAFEKTIVYYDGPDSQGRPTVCGQGGGSIAFVYVNACDGVPNDGIVAHELLHSLGAVPPQAPHDCPPPDDGHTCDTTTDIMYPYADGSNLFALLLDPGRDDYYGHTGSWLDVQDSEYLVRLDAQSQLSLGLQGPGRVVSDIPGVDCTTSCASTWNAGTRLSLSATPTGAEHFVRWGGACSGAVALCNVTVDQATSVSALFAPAFYPLRVTVGGRGVVRGAAGRVFCPSECRVELASHTPVRITAMPAKGWRLKSWSGACRGAARTCNLQMRKASTTRAVFVRAAA